MQGPVNAQSLRELAWTRAEIDFRLAMATAFHPRQTTHRFQGTKEHEAIALTSLHEQVEEPVHSVIQINIGGPRLVLIDESPGAGTDMGMACRITRGLVCLCFHNYSGTTLPLQATAD
jgi:hypothetical protein|tara:strand:- start:22347 stop:22700 length:354 start_codon:yes stop_codon:yes gene_type:complete